AVAGREDPVARRRRATALDVAEDGDARLVAGPLLDELREPVADAAGREPDVAELVDLVLGTGAAFLVQLVALADDHDGEVLAAVVPPAEVVAALVDRDRLLGDQDHVGAARDPAVDSDPTRVAAHHLDD